MTEHSHALSSLVFAKWDFGMAKPKGIKTQQTEIKTNLKLLMATGAVARGANAIKPFYMQLPNGELYTEEG